ncbi:hypothetical protein SEA_LILMAC1015_71 [Arthrobacter phage Lilmac1015]|uniref:Uncharacterized protein n=1 Tax=Arthrobacter phage Lilmac1015 TaxID=2912653 RepID=A0AA49BPV4_9CAUD|nr:hypothetical protein SEA_LILMAC1015_71 [Arthrobacter phage Lilmac1015]
MSKYRLETARPSGWIVEYDGDDPVEYAKAVVGAAVDGRTTRATCVGSAGDPAPEPAPDPVNHVDEEIWVRRRES